MRDAKVEGVVRVEQSRLKSFGENCGSILESEKNPVGKRQELDLGEKSVGFMIDDFLSVEECDRIITRAKNAGFITLDKEFDRQYRSGARLLASSEDLAHSLWTRLFPYFSAREILHINPVGFGNEGIWKPTRLNECFKITKYNPDDQFVKHMDGPWVPRYHESSIFTLIIYLNSQSDTEFHGGDTIFYNEANPDDIHTTITPKAGLALLFTHDTLHSGSPVTYGTKMILKTEVMFTRTDAAYTPPQKALEYREKDGYRKMIRLYSDSEKLLRDRDVEGFVEKYLQALDLQRQEQRSVNITARRAEESNLIPQELMVDIFTQLTPRQTLLCMQVCKRWFYITQHGDIWKHHFNKHWGFITKTLSTSAPIKPVLQDWLGKFRARMRMANQTHPPVVFQLGDYDTIAATVGNPLVDGEGVCKIIDERARTAVVAIGGEEMWHYRTPTRYFYGENAVAKYAELIVPIVTDAHVVNVQLAEHLLAHLVSRLRKKDRSALTGEKLEKWSRKKSAAEEGGGPVWAPDSDADPQDGDCYNPIVFVEPADGWGAMEKQKLVKTLSTTLRPSAVGFVNAAEAICRYYKRDDAVVLDFSESSGTVSVVRDGRVLKDSVKRIKSDSASLCDIVKALRQQTEHADVVDAGLIVAGSGAHMVKAALLADGWKVCESEKSSDIAALRGALAVAFWGFPGEPTSSVARKFTLDISTSCPFCYVPFTMLRRRHHCRGCGAVGCTACMPIEPTQSYTQRRCPRCKDDDYGISYSFIWDL
eukprot:TRINITY_DN4325_c0_g1_i1.p1 TRINITY_DN4325_c0_g1~~TRINITY_DN4325_c0_g1_i1.p1  ORF type:complete len:762 (+),score=128.33 TRINITY_DN4325_c0_g1_i1:86-2371(+)